MKVHEAKWNGTAVSTYSTCGSHVLH